MAGLSSVFRVLRARDVSADGIADGESLVWDAGDARLEPGAGGGGASDRYTVSFTWDDITRYSQAATGAGALAAVGEAGLVLNRGSASGGLSILNFFQQNGEVDYAKNPEFGGIFRVVPGDGDDGSNDTEIFVGFGAHTSDLHDNCLAFLVTFDGTTTPPLLEAITSTGSDVTRTTIATDPTDGMHSYHVTFDGVTASFYVDGTLEAEHTTNLPSGANGRGVLSVKGSGGDDEILILVAPLTFSRDF